MLACCLLLALSHSFCAAPVSHVLDGGLQHDQAMAQLANTLLKP